jgi:hypothetical protein
MSTKSPSNDARPPKKSKGIPLTKELQSHIGGKLRAAYGQLVQEPVPDRFAELLKQLADAEVAQSKNSSPSTDKESNS